MSNYLQKLEYTYEIILNAWFITDYKIYSLVFIKIVGRLIYTDLKFCGFPKKPH